MKLPSLKHRKPIVYISLAIYSLLSAFIIVEACMPSGLSGLQSQFFATISAWFINHTTKPIVPNSIKPLSYLEPSDSSYLGKDENGISNIAIGTTSLIQIPVKYPDKSKKDDTYNYKYTLEHITGNKDDYTTTISSSNVDANTYQINLRITAMNMNNDLYQINVNIAESLKYEYKFHIVELATPTNYESKVEKNTLKIGETTSVITKLLDEKRNDTYLRRYLDESKISRSSVNEGIATIDKYGVIHGVSEGTTTIKFGKYEFPITVTGEHINKPVTNELSLEISADSKSSPSLLDYDYVFEKDENPNDYSSLIYALFSDSSLEDQSLSWAISDPMMGKIAPYKYDENGYPVYQDDNGKPCVRISGYRKKGELTVYCYSNNDNSIYASKVLTVGEAIPTEMTLNVKEDISLYVNTQQVITASFGPKNVNNKKIHVEASNSSSVEILNNDSASVTITGKKVHKTTIKVISIANPELVKELKMDFIAKDAINDDNYEDFHTFIRKATGHVTLFLITAVFGTLFLYFYLEDKKLFLISSSINVGYGAFLALLSELIQELSRQSFGWSEVLMDILGFILGAAITIGIIFLIRAIKNHKKNKNIQKENAE